MGSTEHKENGQPTAALAAVALAVGANVDDAWKIALEAAKQPTDEAAYREAFRLAGEVAYKNFGQA
ncbi:hypothetical protein RI444_15525 [Paenarthrobacter sp. AT5]|uniref:hypothetical protein n=1 Tax=Paenarthrobacter TaxID=1742992 RepID=UPI001A97FDD6|nr:MULTISPECIES: hypothetical protein [Paenarthrobacter]QSZ53257.1 hypothetical protein AYX19_09745 [Paenarthrobacter ureafaciens]WOC59918.1 hypothetical protein RI444_15525 [Paenarthrobacter sp. AT5]